VSSDTFITSPFVGTFYRSSGPETPAFVEVGSTVQRGQPLCIVEAMKLFNELEAEFPCVIEAVLLENAQPVEYGAKLFRVRKL
jgi:acetyl-CoA carboxylase biotin carboxyl carrier protein